MRAASGSTPTCPAIGRGEGQRNSVALIQAPSRVCAGGRASAQALLGEVRRPVVFWRCPADLPGWSAALAAAGIPVAMAPKIWSPSPRRWAAIPSQRHRPAQQPQASRPARRVALRFRLTGAETNCRWVISWDLAATASPTARGPCAATPTNFGAGGEQRRAIARGLSTTGRSWRQLEIDRPGSNRCLERSDLPSPAHGPLPTSYDLPASGRQPLTAAGPGGSGGSASGCFECRRLRLVRKPATCASMAPFALHGSSGLNCDKAVRSHLCARHPGRRCTPDRSAGISPTQARGG